MPRRLGASVPSTVSRLLQGGLLPSPPAWFTAVGTVAPLRPSLTRKVPKQVQDDAQPQASTSKSQENDEYAWKGNRRLSSAKSKKSLKYTPAKPAPIKGLELQDRVRRMFYEDHPFEGFRGTNLVEHDSVQMDDSIGPKGLEWQELRQRSWNPSPEDCVAFILNLHTSHSIPLALAYQSGISQFRSLRASYEISLHSAQVEMESHGFRWPTEFSSIDRLTRAEDRNIMDVLKDKNRQGASSSTGSSSSLEAGPSTASQLLNPVQATTRSWSGGVDHLAGKKQVPGHLEDARNTVKKMSGESTPEDPHGLGESGSTEIKARRQSERRSDVSQLPTESGASSTQEETLPTNVRG